MTREEKVKIAVEMRIDGATLREIGERLGTSRQYAEQILRGTEVDGMFREDVKVRRREAFAAHGRRLVDTEPGRVRVVCEICGKEAVLSRTGKAAGCRDCNRGGPPKGGPPKIDITGQVFTDWTVIERAERPSLWRCRCRCGWEAEVWISNLTGGWSKGCHPCGIKRRDANRARRRA